MLRSAQLSDIMHQNREGRGMLHKSRAGEGSRTPNLLITNNIGLEKAALNA
jgi:hypothetical protein